MENQTRSDFFIGRVNVGFMYGEASSCGLKDKAKISAAAHLSNLFFLQFD